MNYYLFDLLLLKKKLINYNTNLIFLKIEFKIKITYSKNYKIINFKE